MFFKLRTMLKFMAKNFEFDVSDTRNLTNALTKKLHTFIERERERERERESRLILWTRFRSRIKNGNDIRPMLKTIKH